MTDEIPVDNDGLIIVGTDLMGVDTIGARFFRIFTSRSCILI
ncbi:hypothetical protein [Paraclostridium sordellii]|nr:hypothetical protein [Paeniclostridium sordellii]